MKPKFHWKGAAPVSLACLVFTLSAVNHASAADIYWQGGTANWAGGSSGLTGWSTSSTAATPDPTAIPGGNDNLFFNITTNNTANSSISHANGDRAARSITISTSGATNFRAGGSATATSTLTIGVGGLTMNSGAGNVNVGEAPATYGTMTVALAANQVWTNDSTSLLTVTGAVTGATRQLTKSGSGIIRLNGANTYTGATIINEGTLRIANYAGLDLTSGITISGGTATLEILQQGTGSTTNAIDRDVSLHGVIATAGGTGTNLLALTWDGDITLSGNSRISNNGNSSIDINGVVDLSSHNLVFQTDRDGSRIDGNIIGTGGSFTKTSLRNLILTGTNTYTGATTISGGTLTLGATGSIANSSSIVVGAGTTFNVTAVSGGFTLGSLQTITGSGTVTGAMTIAGTLSPGNSPGIMATGSQTWVDGGDYNFQMLDAAGAAGTGFDQIAITGSLDLTALSTAGYALNLWSLSSTGPDVNGDALNFNNSIEQSWIILTTTDGITGFDAADFILNVGANNGTSGFSNSLGGGSFSLGATSNNLVLTFTPVPEPKAAVLGAIGMLLLFRRRR